MSDANGQQPFEGSASIAAMIEDELRAHRIETIVETGTQYGATTAWFLRNYPYLMIHTIEANSAYFDEVEAKLRKTRVMMWLGKSEDILGDLAFDDGERVLLYLDAHGGTTGGTPVLEELKAITDAVEEYGIHCVIAIHDFKVPDRPDLGYDTYGDIELSLGYVMPSMNRVFPDGYTVKFNDVADGACRGLAIFCSK